MEEKGHLVVPRLTENAYSLLDINRAMTHWNNQWILS